jgi:oxygen-independent coproporphyrinogen-3 oxidase
MMIKSLTAIDSLYLHFPFCRHLCNYCDFYKYKTGGEYTLKDFHQYLRESLPLHQKLLEEQGQTLSALKTFYIGGGTPSLWGEEGVEFLSGNFNFSWQKQHEATLEVNPGSWSKEGLMAWKAFGMNRFSLGIQALDDTYLKILDRVHNLKEVHQTLEFFSEHFRNFSVDFILGLPVLKDKKRDILKELKEILVYKPTHLSLYILTVGKNYPHYKTLPSEEVIEEEFLLVAEYLKSLGYIHYEVSNFA